MNIRVNSHHDDRPELVDETLIMPHSFVMFPLIQHPIVDKGRRKFNKETMGKTMRAVCIM